jgi:hypothetical protein
MIQATYLLHEQNTSSSDKVQSMHAGMISTTTVQADEKSIL